jgi:hypothetical protein
MWQTRQDSENADLAGKFLAVLPMQADAKQTDIFLPKHPSDKPVWHCKCLPIKGCPIEWLVSVSVGLKREEDQYEKKSPKFKSRLCVGLLVVLESVGDERCGASLSKLGQARRQS